MTIDSFQEKVMQLKPNNFMALNGAAPGIVGSSDSGSNAVLELQRACIEFVRAYKSGNAGAAEAARKELVAKILVAHTFNAINEGQADDLLDALHALKEERR